MSAKKDDNMDNNSEANNDAHVKSKCPDEKRKEYQGVAEAVNLKKKANDLTMVKTMCCMFWTRIILVLIGYIMRYFNWSLTLPVVGICTVIWFETKSLRKSEKISKKVRNAAMKKEDVLNILEELPSWITFPDRERAEWLNEIIWQLWPSINSYIIKYCRTKIQTKIQKKYQSFRFEDIDFGATPPKIDGVKVYNRNVCKDSVIIDFDVFYDGDCNIGFSVSGAQLGKIKDFQLGVEIRVVLKPLLLKLPIIGGVQVFFLNTPDIDFDLEGVSGIPGFSYFVRQKIEEKIRKKIVFPNKITKRFSKSVEAAELKSLEPEGVLRVHVFEAKDLEKKDVTGKSDPYVILQVGAQEFKTPVIKRDLNPQWDYYCEFVILDPVAQQLYFKMFDQDELNEDDFMGSGVVEIHRVIQEGKNDQWFKLDSAKHGRIHLRFTWLGLSSDTGLLEAALQEIKLLKIDNISTSLLTVYIDSAQNLQKVKNYKKPDPYLIITVGNNQVKSRVKKHTTDPVWEQGFTLLLRNPEHDSLIISIIDKQTDTKIDQLVYAINNLFKETDLQISKEEFHLQKDSSSTITLSLQLRILQNKHFEHEDSDSDTDEEFERKPSRSSNRLSKTASPQVPVTTPTQKEKSESKFEEEIQKLIESETASSKIVTSPSFRIKPESLGQIEASVGYSELRQKLVITVHKITNIPLKDPDDIPDPYVKLRLIAQGVHGSKQKTKVVVDSCNPIFEETFEYLLSLSDLPKHQLLLTVKNKKFFSSNVIGQAMINLKSFHNLEEPIREWYDLTEEQHSD